MRCLKVVVAVLGLVGSGAGRPAAGGDADAARQEALGLTTFLRRLISVDHLPLPSDAKTEMTSTWDRTGGNNDGLDFKRIEGDRNILLDVDGPGCVHRVFTGMLGAHVAGTRIRVLLDSGETPVFDMPVERFFDDKEGPIPYPLVFHKTYPGTLFPIPFAMHCRIELESAAEKKNWGNYWQVTYTRYPAGTAVETLRRPLSDAERRQLEEVCRTWLRAESSPPDAPGTWTVEQKTTLAPNSSGIIASEIRLSGGGVIRQLRVRASPSTPEALAGIGMKILWDGAPTAAVDMPIGCFFGNVATGYADRYCSLLLGVDEDYAYCRFPMPFAAGAVLRFENGSAVQATLDVAVDVGPAGPDADAQGRFHATPAKTEVEAGLANRERLPRTGPQNVPVHEVLHLEETRGKYVGVFLHVDWPLAGWWGEGDWLIWTDEEGWPPAYHGTGSEEYFNSGWCLFDRKAVSGIIREPTMRPGHVGVYTFHLNDSFSFDTRVRVAEEIMPGMPRKEIRPATWRSTAYWYGFPPRKEEPPERERS